MKKRGLSILILTVVFLLMAFGVHSVQEYRFYNIESNDLFLYSWSDIIAKVMHPGGVANLLSSFLTQFMRIPFAGPVIVTLLYLLVSYIFYKVLNTGVSNKALSGLALLPSVFLFLCMENDYYRFQGHVAFLLMLSTLFAYVSVRKEEYRFLAGVVIVPCLYHIAGSVALVFAISAVVWEIVCNGLKGMKSLVYLLVGIVTAFIYVKLSLVSGWEYALTPFMYYDWPSTYYFPTYAWVTVPALILLSGLLSRINVKESYAIFFALTGVVVSVFIAGNFYTKVHSSSYYRLIQEQYWAENGDWDQIIETADRRQPTFLISYLNLALAQKGVLIQNFKYYNPRDLSSLMSPIPNLKTGLTMQSAVYQAWDYHAAARQAAFDANVVTSGNRNPRQLMVLIRTNIALGSYDVADKYISILEKTLFYRGFAEEMRQMLDMPSDAVLPVTDEYARYDGIKGDMRDILEVNPSQYILSQFYQLYQILEKEGMR